MPGFVEKLRAFRPAFIEGFPSTLLAFARYLNRRREVAPTSAVFTTSEPLYRPHRQEIEEAFEAKVFDYYGHAERAVTAAECASGSMHVNPEYGIVEILQGDRSVPPGETGEIVATGLTNPAMPLIRYRTGDASRLTDGSCDCGRETPLLGSIDGRMADCLRTPDGRILPGDGVMEALYGVRNVKESQIVQESIDRIVVKLVKDEPGEPVDERGIRSNMERCLGRGLLVTFEYVESLWDAKVSKKRWVVSKIGGGGR
jgi:phenylacetate-CoA ligase